MSLGKRDILGRISKGSVNDEWEDAGDGDIHGTQPESLQIEREQQVLKILVIDKLRALDNFLGVVTW